MANNAISISYKLTEEGNGLKKLILDSKELKEAMSQTIKVSTELERKLINFAALCTSVDSLSNTLNSLQSTLRGLSDAYAAQSTVETQLAVNMRNTMAAREEDIQSIKDLCSAQQELGVIGDEVQLAGAQELTTYLSKKQSLEQLIPVMNDMLAQQYGLNATQENAAQIATMLGKVMDGQTGALSRYGYTFDEAQEKILKFGTESQRAAVLCEVIENSVGGMNSELAKTDAGKLKQVDNTLGDIKESLGRLVQGVMPFVEITAQSLVAAGDILKFAQTIKVATTAVMGWQVKQVALKAALIMGTGSIEKATQAVNIYSSAAAGSAASTNVLKIALRGLLITSGIGIAIAAVTTAICYLMNASDEAAESTNKLLSAEERAKRDAEQLEQMRQQEVSTLTNTRAALEINISKLKEFNGTKEQEKKLVNEMNDTYGETMGYFSSVADWYNALVSNSEAYCRQMVIEARTRTLANQIAQKKQERHDIEYDEFGIPRLYSKKNKTKDIQTGTATIGAGGGFSANYDRVEVAESSDWHEAKRNIDRLKAETEALEKQLNDAAKEAAGINFNVTGSTTRPTDTNKPKITSKSSDLIDPKSLDTLEDFDNKLRFLNERRIKASKEQLSSIDAEIAKVKKLRDEFEGVEKVTTQDSPSSIKYLNTLEELANAESYWREIQQKGSVEEILNAQKEIDKINEKKATYEALTTLPSLMVETGNIENELAKLDGLSGKELLIQLNTIGADKLQAQIDTVSQAIDALSAQMHIVGIESDSYAELKDMRENLRGTRDELLGYKEDLDKTEETDKAYEETTSQLTGAFSQLGSAIGGAAGEWLQYGANTAQAIATAIPQLVALTSTHKAAAGEKTADAAAGAAAAVSSIPFVGPALAVAAVASIVAALAGVPKFANGGIISGPTIGLMGEYAGASNNPEVVAPLDKLRGMLNPAASPVIVGGTLRASGREIICVLANETRIASKSGKRTNIKL